MKDFEYVDQPGFENMNTPTAEDIFELSYMRGMKDREVYDFSKPEITGNEDLDNQGKSYPGVFGNFIPSEPFKYARSQNLAYWTGATWSASTALPGSVAEFVVDGYQSIDDLEHIEISEQDHGYDSFGRKLYSPSFNEDVAVWLGASVASAFGTGDVDSKIKYFRSGYIELSIKIEKSNCIIAYGSGLATNNGTFTTEQAYETAIRPLQDRPVSVDSSTSITSEPFSDLSALKIGVKDGKLFLNFEKFFGNTAQVYELYGNKNIADNQWHHVVINFAKEGILRENGKKINSKPIQFWVDGKLDKQDDSLRTNKQIFFPTIQWLGADPLEAFGPNNFEHPYITGMTGWTSYDRELPSDGTDYIGWSDTAPDLNKIYAHYFNPESKANNFKGSIHTYVSGINVALSKQEIEFRKLLYFKKYRRIEKPSTASALMVDPAISSNKPKALKLFWNNLILERSKNGIELDNNFSVESYSVTHKTLNSPTEINNADLAIEKDLKFLSDVRFAIRDNVIPFGPGKLTDGNYADAYALVGRGEQWDMTTYGGFNTFRASLEDGTHKYVEKFLGASVKNYTYSGAQINDGDRILLTNQFDPKDNGIWIYNGPDSFLSRAEDADSPHKIENSVVRVTDGIYKDTSWMMNQKITSFNQSQIWNELEYHPDSKTIGAQPIFGTRWSNEDGTPRLIDLQNDIDLSNYDLICFMNYPNSETEVVEHLKNFTSGEARVAYDNFVSSLINAAATGSSVYVSSPKLAEDMGIVSTFTYISQEKEDTDAQSAAINPFQPGEPAERYYDTHRNNRYQVVTLVPGLTNKTTYILKDFVNYVPEDDYSFEEWHGQYAYKQTGLEDCCEFYIPGTGLREISESENLPGYIQNLKRSKDLAVIDPSDILAGTEITRVSNTYYNGDTAINNPYHGYVSTLIVHNNQILGTQPISGKIFVNCVEDGYTFSKEEYNKAYIQDVSLTDIGEDSSTILWQYSTSRLDRKSKRTGIAGISKEGQTVPTIAGGGPLIQSQTASSSGIIRSETDSQDSSKTTTLYRDVEEEIYPLIEIPTYSMTWLGLQWLTGQ